MVGFCFCFSPSSTKSGSDDTQLPEPHAACHVVQLAHQEQAGQQAVNNSHAEEDVVNIDTGVRQFADYAPVSAKLASHQITISPEPRPAASTDGSELAVDVVRQSEVDTVKGLSPRKAAPEEQLQAMQYKAADTIISPTAEAGADTGNCGSFADGLKSKHISKATPSSADKAAKSTPASGKPAPWGSRGAAAQVTPMRPFSAKTGPNTPSSGPSPSVTRPTCASVARAQAVSASKSASGSAGSMWKF